MIYLQAVAFGLCAGGGALLTKHLGFPGTQIGTFLGVLFCFAVLRMIEVSSAA